MSLYVFIFLLTYSYLLYTAIISSKYYLAYIQKRPLSSFLKDTLTTPNSRVFTTYITC
jgi:hypothetical protein